MQNNKRLSQISSIYNFSFNSRPLIHSTPSHIIGDYDVGDFIEIVLDVSRVYCTGHLKVDSLESRLIPGHELSLNVYHRFVIFVVACNQTIRQ